MKRWPNTVCSGRITLDDLIGRAGQPATAPVRGPRGLPVVPAGEGGPALANLIAELDRRLTATFDDDGSHDIGHMRRVCQTALEIAEGEGGDLEVLVTAAYLHDLVNLPKDDPDRAQASRRSAEAAQPILRDLGIAQSKHDAIAHAIEAHSFSAAITPRTTEAQILQDADRLDALGAIGIARCFYVAGRMGASLFDPTDPVAQGRSLDDRRFALDHFETKLFPVADALITPTARQIGARRVAHMRSFVQTLLAEIGTPCG